MAGDASTRNLIRCDFCQAEAHCVGFDDTHRYFECDASPANHEWSELRNPECARCGDPLPKHVELSMQGRTHWLCPRAIAHTTFVCPEFLEDNVFAWRK